MYYSSIGILSLVLHVIINSDTLFRKRNDGRVKVRKKYRSFLFAIMIYYVADSLWGLLLEMGLISLTYVDTVLFFLSMGLSVFMWLNYIAVFLNMNEFWTRVLKVIAWLVLGSETVALIVNFFVPVMFYFNENGEYVASAARYFILIVQLVLFALIAIDTFVVAAKLKERKRRHFIAIGLSGMIMALFILLQAFFPMMPFYSVGCLLATTIIHSFVVVDERVESSRQLDAAKTVAYKDSLTNVRNINAYTEFKENVDKDIKRGVITEFAVVVFDLNDLKQVNDTRGHEAGDKYIQDGCRLICHVFRHSPVFRIGGDEFVSFLMNADYMNRANLIVIFNKHIDRNLERGGVIVSSGISDFDAASDSGYDEVFSRADELMYSRKKELKQIKSEMFVR